MHVVTAVKLHATAVPIAPEFIPPPSIRARGDERADARARERRTCAHCGAPVAKDEVYCCGGCAWVSRLLREEGLGAYYTIKDPVTAPAEGALRPAADFGWLAEAARAAELRAGTAHAAELDLEIQGISCAACIWLIERLFARRTGAGDITVAAETGHLRLRWRAGAFDAPAFARELQRFGYLMGPSGTGPSALAGESEGRVLARKVGLAAALAMNTMLFALPHYFGMSPDFEYARLFDTLALAFATLTLFTGGNYFISRAVRALRERVAHLDLPIALGIIGAYLGSLYGWLTANPECQYFDFVSAFITLMLVGRWAQVAAVERNRRRLLEEQVGPARVNVWRESGWAEVPAENLATGDRFRILPGGLVPVEARLANPEAEFALAWITGEVETRRFYGGQRIPAGASLAAGQGAELYAAQPWAGSLLAELLRPLERTPERTRLIERVVKAYLIGILGTATAAGIAWGVRTGDLTRTGAVVISILVVSCPCALGLAFPLTEELATVRLRKRGVFIRAGDIWSRLERVRTVVFDKTGTLTGDTPTLRDACGLERLDPEARAALLTLVRDNVHPVGRALYEAISLRGWSETLPGIPTEEVGQGVRLGPWALERANEAGADTRLTHNGLVRATFSFAEQARRGAGSELTALRKRGLGLAILSGDRKAKVATLAAECGIAPSDAIGEQDPRAKAAWLDAHGGDSALMLGDGANDSLAFDHSLCRGTPAIHGTTLTAKADFYYLGRGLEGVRALFETNDARRATQLALLVFMVLYNLTALGLATSGHMNPLFAAVLMPLSSVATLVIVWAGLRRASISV